jgi:glycosyltransferase involved in cell wall biosynthesis
MSWPDAIVNVNKFHYVRGGSERYYFDLAEILRERGHRVIAFSMAHASNVAPTGPARFVPEVRWGERRGGLRALATLGHIIHSRTAERAMDDLLQSERIDLAHLHNISHQISPSILSPLRRRGAAIVQTLHDYKLICPNYRLFTEGAPCERCRGGRYWNALLHRCNRGETMGSLAIAIESSVHRATSTYARGVDLFIAPSEFLMRKAIAFGVPEERLRHIPYPMKLPPRDPGTAAGARNDAAGAPFFLYTGRLAPEKGIMTLLNAVERVPEATTVIAGDGELSEEVRARASRLAHVQLVGHKDRDEVVRLQRSALSVIVPSEWYENLPLAVMEAHAAATPVIGARIGGIPEMIEEGRTGWLFPPGDSAALADCLRDALRDPARARAMGDAGRTWVAERYDPSRHYDAIRAAYEDARAFARAKSAWRWGRAA